MASPILHIQDSYYFEVPKLLYAYDYQKRQQFPKEWIALDPEYQQWEAERLHSALQDRDAKLPAKDVVLHDWQHFVHADHANFGKPLKEFLSEKYGGHLQKFGLWSEARKRVATEKKEPEVDPSALTFEEYLKQAEEAHSPDQAYLPFLLWHHADTKKLQAAAKEARNVEAWKADEHVAEWDKTKIDAYNAHLSGKILIPQPFATLRNLYEKESGFAISKYLLIEIFVALVLVLLFSRFARKIEGGRPAKGIFWNLIEVFLVFIRDQIARPVLGAHDHSHAEAEGHGHDQSGHEDHGNAHAAHAHAAPAQHHASADPATQFLPLLWTIFFFILGCNLMGMVPWAGAPTASFSVTLALAGVTLATVIVFGMLQFGVVGFFLNQVPGMEVPWYMAILIKPMIFVIELLGLLIKHGVLAVRLLANMAAGHLVILGIMGAAFGADAAIYFTASGAPAWQWFVAAPVAVLASAAFSVLELFVAFLQAYVFTFLSALFIGAAIHKH